MKVNSAMKRCMLALLCMALMAGAAFAQEESLAVQAQAVLQAFMSGEYEAIAAQFDENMAAAVDANGLEGAWESVAAQYGAVTGVVGAQEDPASGAAALVIEHEYGQTALTVVRDEAGRIAGLSIAPMQQAAQTVQRDLPEGVTAQPVTLFAGTQRELKGELLLPQNAGEDTPYAVLVHGSGPSDMDETIGACKPLRDLAYDLAELGVGSLRFDKITYACPQYPLETVEEEYLEPAAEALAVLKAAVGPCRAVLIGHSQGGMLAPWLVSACGFDGGVALSGTPWQLWEVSCAQNMALIDMMPEAQREVLAIQIRYEQEKAQRLAEMTDEEAAKTTVFGVNAVYQRYLARMDQAQIAAESGKPYLFLWGEKDVQVERAAFDAWEERLGSDARFTYKRYPGLNHLLMPAGEGDSVANVQEAYNTPNVMDKQVAADIAQWLKTW